MKSDFDGQFHRAQIIEVSGQSIAVIYIDDGLCERVRRVYDIAWDLSKVKPFSIKGMIGSLQSIKAVSNFLFYFIVSNNFNLTLLLSNDSFITMTI